MTSEDDAAAWRKRCIYVMGAYGDPEGGHSLEDKLLEDFVSAVSWGKLADPARVASVIAVELLERDRNRWYA